MPFTVSHAAAVLVFRRFNLVWSAVIIGSMAPDFPYILGTTENRDLGHHFPSVILFTLPASFAALWLFHNVIKRPFVGLLPVALQARLRGEMAPFRFAGPRRLFAILISVVLGILTHIVWDSFTHSRTWPWRHIPWLQGRLQVPGMGSVPMYGAMQYASSILGLLALGIWIALWYRRTATLAEYQPQYRPKSRFPLALSMFAVAALVGLIRASIAGIRPWSFHNADQFMLVFGVTALALSFWQILLYCLVVSSHQVWTIT